MAKSDLLSQILKSQLCAGCGLCESTIGADTIRVDLDQNGFLRPHHLKPLNLEQENLLRAVCPGLSLEHKCYEGQYSPLWGPLIQSQVGYATDEDVRQSGSSGGVITALLIYLLESKTVDSVIHIGESKHNPLENTVKVSKSKADVLGCSGSRYSPSAPLKSLDSILNCAKTFAVVGKPCDIAALRKYGEVNPDIGSKIPYMISFVCAGVPSIKGTLAILEKFCLSQDEVKSFRYRGDGWPGNTRIETIDGRKFELDYSQSWGEVLNKYIQFRCKICPDGTGEFADIVCGDAWFGGVNGYPDFSERDGRSLILTRTKIGEELTQKCIKDSVLCCQTLGTLAIQEMQPYQALRKKMILSRIFAMRLMNVKAPKFKGFMLGHLALRSGFFRNLKNFLGMILRCLKLR